MAQTAHSLVPVNPKSLMSIDPQKNWHRFPSPITAAMLAKSDDAAKAVTYTGGVANTGAAAGNDGEVGTINSTSVTRGVTWNTQGEKETALGMPIATDITKSYHGTRGSIEPFTPYPTGGKPPSVVNLSASTVSGAAALTTVGTLSTTDANVGDTFTYRLIDSAYGRFVLIDPNTIKTNKPLPAGSYSIRVRSTDQTGMWGETTIAITVT